MRNLKAKLCVFYLLPLDDSKDTFSHMLYIHDRDGVYCFSLLF
jgi:hypothetical protein